MYLRVQGDEDVEAQDKDVDKRWKPRRASEKAKRPGGSIEPACEMALALTGGEGKQGRWVVNVAIQQRKSG